MRCILLCLLACVVGQTLAFPYQHYQPQHLEHFAGKAKFEADIYFEGCIEETCYKDQYRGYDCHDGYCGRVCDFDRCWQPEYKAIKGKARIEGEIIFKGCYEETCHKGNYHGYDCHDGYCGRICDFDHCWEPEYKTFKGKARIAAEVIFEGCYEETCHKGNYHGYDCHDGYCGRICDFDHCWEPEYKTFKGKARIAAEVIFEGCYEETCHKGNYHGYDCHDGYCGRICDFDHCWEPEYNVVRGRATIEADVIFDGCYEDSCHRDDYYGYDCHDGYCGKICDLHHCWKPQYKAFKGKARIEAEVIFEGCHEESCHKGNYHGYDCHDGYCGRICDFDHCWEPEYKVVRGKAKIEVDMIFEGCYEDSCHKDGYYGYDCHDGYCGKICDLHHCWHPEYKTLRGKVRVEADVVFEGCYEDTCYNDQYYGQDCHNGYCARICDIDHCWQSKHKTFSGKARIEADVVFEGCYEETCHRDHYFGYDCHDGYCGKICDMDQCWEPKYKAIKGKARIEANVIFEGCFEESCHQGQYRGYNCHNQQCKRVCDFDRCWEPESKAIKIKGKLIGDIVFEGCMKESCEQGHYHGYDCKLGRCAFVCDKEKCHESFKPYGY
ncbi:hypothetical protein AAHC03_0721 [Spirometra sp. Aus1]